jgi:hypothetical protein
MYPADSPDSRLLWKYLGVDQLREPRLTFLEDGLFRITQPRALNDPFEVKPRVLIEEFADEDWDIARAHAEHVGIARDDDEMIRMMFLETYPTARFDERRVPALFRARIPDLREEPFRTVAEIDEFRATQVQKSVEEALNKSIGVFSVTEDPLNLLMWAHYGAQHCGIVVGLDLQHGFFREVGSLRQVEYRRERVAVSSNGGRIRVAGHALDTDALPPVETLLRKSTDWVYEREWRLLVPLARGHNTRLEPRSGDSIHLLRFPKAAIRTLLLGARLTDTQVADIATRVRRDQRWQHVAIRRTRLSARKFELETFRVNGEGPGLHEGPAPR